MMSFVTKRLLNLYSVPDRFTRVSSVIPKYVDVLSDDRKLLVFSKSYCTSTTESKSAEDSSQDCIARYVEPEVQSLLKKMTGLDHKRVFRNRKLGQKLREPKYKFMTEKELEEAVNEARDVADNLLKMPPVLPARKPIDKVLSYDPQLQGYDIATIVCTDISMNISNRDRLITAREPDGTLRLATWEERDIMNAIYFPVEGREITPPSMFTDESILKSVLDRASEEDNTYEFVLDRACIQFEPDDPLYIRVVEMTYETVDDKQHYNFLYSTRHFGPFAFHLVRTRRMDNLLLYYIAHDRISDDALNLVKLFHELFPKSRSKQEMPKCSTDLNKIRAYTQYDAVKKGQLDLALNTLEEQERLKLDREEGLKKAHGLN